jgi:hypothetical protein
MIESAAVKAGSQTNLAKVIAMNPNDLSSVKAGKRGLTMFACFKLAELTGIDVKKVIAASELITEKNEDKRAFFAPFVLNGIAPLASALVALSLTLAPEKSYASDSLYVTNAISQPAQSTGYDTSKNVIWIMRSINQGAGLP